MDPIKLIADIITTLPIGSIQREKAELLKEHIGLMETRVKMAEERARNAEERCSRSETERDEAVAEARQLRDQLAVSMVTDEFEERGPFLVRKGTDHLLCPNCKIRLAQRDTYWMCTKCKWGHEEPRSTNWRTTRITR